MLRPFFQPLIRVFSWKVIISKYRKYSEVNHLINPPLIHHVLSCPYRLSTNLTKTTKCLIFAPNDLVLSKYSCLSRNASFQNDSPLYGEWKAIQTVCFFSTNWKSCVLIELQNCHGNLSNAHKSNESFSLELSKITFQKQPNMGGKINFFGREANFGLLLPWKAFKCPGKWGESFWSFFVLKSFLEATQFIIVGEKKIEFFSGRMIRYFKCCHWRV